MHHHQICGDNSFELNIPTFFGLHPVLNVALLRPYFPPLLDTSEIAENLKPTEINPDYMQQKSNNHIVDTQIKGTRNKGSNFINLSKQGSSYTKASGSPEAKFNKNFLI
jgi:hypothetical protein